MATRRVLDIFDMSTDISLNGGILKDSVARLVEGAVLKDKVVGIA